MIIKLAIQYYWKYRGILNAYQQDLIVLIGYTIKTLIFSDFFYTSMANEIHL